MSVFDHGFLYGDGVFEGIRVYGGRLFRLAPHLDRLPHPPRIVRPGPEARHLSVRYLRLGILNQRVEPHHQIFPGPVALDSRGRILR